MFINYGRAVPITQTGPTEFYFPTRLGYTTLQYLLYLTMLYYAILHCTAMSFKLSGSNIELGQARPEAPSESLLKSPEPGRRAAPISRGYAPRKRKPPAKELRWLRWIPEVPVRRLVISLTRMLHGLEHGDGDMLSVGSSSPRIFVATNVTKACRSGFPDLMLCCRSLRKGFLFWAL